MKSFAAHVCRMNSVMSDTEIKECWIQRDELFFSVWPDQYDQLFFFTQTLAGRRSFLTGARFLVVNGEDIPILIISSLYVAKFKVTASEGFAFFTFAVQNILTSPTSVSQRASAIIYELEATSQSLSWCWSRSGDGRGSLKGDLLWNM